MSHPLVLALFADKAGAARGAAAVRQLGLSRDDLSIVARGHREEGKLARELGGTPGVDLEDSRPAAVLGELGAEAVAAVAIVMPGIGPIVAAGPLAAAFGEITGHAAGGVAEMLAHAGVAYAVGAEWEDRVREGAVLVGAHVRTGAADNVTDALKQAGAESLIVAAWR